MTRHQRNIARVVALAWILDSCLVAVLAGLSVFHSIWGALGVMAVTAFSAFGFGVIVADWRLAGSGRGGAT